MENSHNPTYVKETNKIWGRNFARARYWGAGLMGYWGLILVVAAIDKWSRRFYPRASLVLKSQLFGLPPVKWLRGHVLLPSLLPRGKHLTYNMIGGVIPTRFESLVIFFYFALVFIGESVNYETSQHNVFWPRKKEQLTRYVGDRTAIISMFILVPTYLFAGRNNFLLWITGWRQSTFLTFHRWLARMAVVSSLVHTFTMLLNDYWLHTVHERKYSQYWRWGSVAMICGVVMVVQSFPLVRRNWYELFLYGHIILAVFFLIGVWIHLEELGYGQYAYAIASIWAFDRFIRLVRIGSFGIKYATVSITDEKHLLVKINCVSRLWKQKPKPGAFGYLYFLTGPLSWFQSHPFSVKTLEDGNSIAFQITVKRGLTKRLYNDLCLRPNHTRQVKIALEGFYGEYNPVIGYDEILMFASGSGATSPMEYLKEIVESNKANIDSKESPHMVKYVKFYWMVSDLSYTRVLAPDLISMQNLGYVHPIVYVTKPQSQLTNFIGNKTSSNTSSSTNVVETFDEDPEYSKNEEVKCTSLAVGPTENIIADNPPSQPESDPELPAFCETYYGARPDLDQLLIRELRDMRSADNVAIMTCAHPVACDKIRNAVARETTQNGRSGALDLIELLQIW